MKIEENAKANLIRLYNLYKNNELTEEEFELCCRYWGACRKEVEKIEQTS